MTSSLVGSEMCIRDRRWSRPCPTTFLSCDSGSSPTICPVEVEQATASSCLLYTSDAADDM
eukprot:4209314-Prorocentrum_lima.AAC.1